MCVIRVQVVQTVVQSRRGDKIRTRSVPTGNDWVSTHTHPTHLTHNPHTHAHTHTHTHPTYTRPHTHTYKHAHTHSHLTQFNLSLPDDKQVSAELKRSLEGRLPEQDCPVCLEIIMDTNDGDSLVLETWTLTLDPL